MLFLDFSLAFNTLGFYFGTEKISLYSLCKSSGLPNRETSKRAGRHRHLEDFYTEYWHSTATQLYVFLGHCSSHCRTKTVYQHKVPTTSSSLWTTRLVGRTTNNDEVNYRSGVRQSSGARTAFFSSMWGRPTRFLWTYRKHPSSPTAPLTKERAAVERGCILAMPISKDSSWTNNTTSLAKKAQTCFYFLCKLKKVRVLTPMIYSLY